MFIETHSTNVRVLSKLFCNSMNQKKNVDPFLSENRKSYPRSFFFAKFKMALYFLPTSRGGKNLILDNEIYYLKNRKNEFSYWRCRRFQHSCPARVTLVNDVLKTRVGQHNHESAEGLIAKKEFEENLKKRVVAEGTTPIPKIYNNEIGKEATSVENAANIPSYNTIKNRLYKARHEMRPVLPKAIEELLLTEEWCRIKENNFLLVDDGSGDERFLVFCTAENLKLLCSSHKLWMDGTFKIVPRLFKQLYTIHSRFMETQFFLFNVSLIIQL
nr:uncharacterized protein LOC122268734 [Parasteatoda tepidariorum]